MIPFKLMKLHLREITETEKSYHYTEADEWLSAIVISSDEADTRPPAPIVQNPSKIITPPKLERPISLNFKANRLESVYMLNGHINTSVQLICSRCADVMTHPISHSFSNLYTQDAALAGVEPDRPGVERGHARHAHDTENEDEDIELTYLTVEYIDLDGLASEQIHLQIPFQPLCKPDCKGLCLHCGTNQNTGKCACAKLHTSSPFASLQKRMPS